MELYTESEIVEMLVNLPIFLDYKLDDIRSADGGLRRRTASQMVQDGIKYLKQEEKNRTADIVKSLFTDKYTKDDKLHTLAKLERSKDNELLDLVKQHQPEYYYEGIFGPEVAKFKLMSDLGIINL